MVGKSNIVTEEGHLLLLLTQKKLKVLETFIKLQGKICQGGYSLSYNCKDRSQGSFAEGANIDSAAVSRNPEAASFTISVVKKFLALEKDYLLGTLSKQIPATMFHPSLPLVKTLKRE